MPGPEVGSVLPVRGAPPPAGASRSDRKTKNLPSRDQVGFVSFFSLVKVSCRVLDTPCVSDTR